jgi:SAM-dependent methyltransferase
VLQAARPNRLLDVGCNSGVYSELAVDAGAEVVALDTDQDTVDRLCRRLKGSGKPILPLVVDLANPTPAVGWRNSESAGFLDRCMGKFDGLLMLAVIHHLLLHDHVPLAQVAELCASLTTRTLIIEWVPPTDSMFRELVRGRDAIFGGITEPAFRETFGAFFLMLAERKLENGRILFHFERRREG